MTNSEWLEWFFYGKQFWMAPVRIVVNFLIVFGALGLGTAERKIKYILFGIAVLLFEVETIHKYKPDLKGFVQFDLLAVKLLYGLVIVVIAILFVAAYKINNRRQEITAKDNAKEMKT